MSTHVYEQFHNFVENHEVIVDPVGILPIPEHVLETALKLARQFPVGEKLQVVMVCGVLGLRSEKVLLQITGSQTGRQQSMAIALKQKDRGYHIVYKTSSITDAQFKLGCYINSV